MDNFIEKLLTYIGESGKLGDYWLNKSKGVVMEMFVHFIACAIIGAAYAFEPFYAYCLIGFAFYQKLESIREAIADIELPGSDMDYDNLDDY